MFERLRRRKCKLTVIEGGREARREALLVEAKKYGDRLLAEGRDHSRPYRSPPGPGAQ